MSNSDAETKTDTTVLVVEDEQQLAEMYSIFLSDKYAVRTATSGEEALELADETIDVAVLDRRMPGMTGDEVLEALRERNLDVRVAMVTAVDPGDDILDMPFDAYLEKPVEQSELLDVVEMLRKRTKHDTLAREFFALASKKVALESSGRANDDVIKRVVTRMEEIQSEISGTLENVTDDLIPDESDE